MRIFILLIGSGLIFSAIFLFTSDSNASYMKWAPGWVLIQALSNSDKLGLVKYSDKEQFYLASGNFWALLKLKLIALVIYIFGNFGIRVLGLIYLPVLVFKKSREAKLLWIFILISTIIAISLPILFNLGGNAYNVTQFTPYALVLTIFPTIAFLELLFKRINSINRNLAISVLIGILFLAVPVSAKEVIGQLPLHGAKITINEMEALKRLHDLTSRNDVIMINTPLYETGLYVNTLTERRIYLADAGYTQQTLIDPKPRLKIVNEIFDKYNFPLLKELPVTYFYIKSNHPWAGKKDYDKYLTEVFTNEAAYIYKVK